MDDRIEKSAVLAAPLDRVWAAIADSGNFGTWFGMKVEGPFVTGTTVCAVMTGTAVDEEIAAQQQTYAGTEFALQIIAVEPKKRFVFRWNPLAESELADLTTLVEFTLSEVDGGVLLHIVESGFDLLPPDRRAAAFADNSGGWAVQLDLIRRFVTEPMWV